MTVRILLSISFLIFGYLSLNSQGMPPNCDPGYYNDGGSCESCPTGKFSTGGNITLCTDCPAGRYNPNPGQEFCLDCPIGTFSPNVGATSCLPCSTATVTGLSTCPAASIPTLAEWGLIILGIIMITIGLVGYRRLSPKPSSSNS